nr:gluconokinase [Gordonia soli]
MFPPIVVMGVSGSGKSSVGALLAQYLEVPFVDGDDLHSAADIASMAAGHPLDDAAREPWLDRCADWLAEHRATGAVLPCSALRRSYRDRIRRGCPTAEFVHLVGSRDLIASRMVDRTDHFMPVELLESQFETLEPLEADERGIEITIDRPVTAIVERIVEQLIP